MKRYLFGLLAVAIAMSAFAFKGSKELSKKRALIPFKYQPANPADYSQSSVQTKTNWVQGTNTCPTGTDKACTFEVDSDYLNGDGSLGASVTIIAVEGSEDDMYRVQSGNRLNNIVNKD